MDSMCLDFAIISLLDYFASTGLGLSFRIREEYRDLSLALYSNYPCPNFPLGDVRFNCLEEQ